MVVPCLSTLFLPTIPILLGMLIPALFLFHWIRRLLRIPESDKWRGLFFSVIVGLILSAAFYLVLGVDIRETFKEWGSTFTFFESGVLLAACILFYFELHVRKAANKRKALMLIFAFLYIVNFTLIMGTVISDTHTVDNSRIIESIWLNRSAAGADPAF